MALPGEHADQYRMLREEISKLARASRTVELCCLIAVAAILAWLVTHETDPPMPLAVWFLPSVVAVLGCIRSVALYKRAGVMAEYLRRIEEKHFTDPDLPGWERFYAAKGKLRSLAITVVLYWVLLITASAMAPFLLGVVDGSANSDMRAEVDRRL